MDTGAGDPGAGGFVASDPGAGGFDGLDAQTPADLRARGGLKWNRYAPDVLAAWVAESDYGTAPAVTAAVRAQLAGGDLGYLADAARAALQRACAGFQARAYGWPLAPERVFLVPHVLAALDATISRLTRPGSAVVLPTPAYMPFVTAPARLGRELVEIPFDESGSRPVLDLATIEAACAAGAGMVVLCNPHNPLGVVHTEAELRALADVVAAHDVRVFADEIHAPLRYDGQPHVPFASLSARAAEQAVTATSTSKSFNMPGLKCAQLILTRDADLEVWAAHGAQAEFDTSPLGVRAATAAYDDGEVWLAGLVAHLDGNRRLFADALAEALPEVGHRMPEGTYLGWLDCRALHLPESAGAFFLRTARVALADGIACGAAGIGRARVNLAMPRPLLAELVDRLAAALR